MGTTVTPEELEMVATKVAAGKVAAIELPSEAVLFCPECGDIHKHSLVTDPKHLDRVAVKCLKCEKVATMEKRAVQNWLTFHKA